MELKHDRVLIESRKELKLEVSFNSFISFLRFHRKSQAFFEF